MTHHNFSFHFQKALQAAAYILREAGGRMGYVDLMKMLYIADRECLAAEGETITGDAVSALKKGPVLRTVLNLIKGRDSQSEQWHRFIGTRFNRGIGQSEVFIRTRPGEDELYRYEKEVLKRVFEEHKDKDLVAYTHTFPEWQKYEKVLNDPTMKDSYPITLRDIIEGIDKPGLLDMVNARIAEIKDHKKLFGR